MSVKKPHAIFWNGILTFFALEAISTCGYESTHVLCEDRTRLEARNETPFQDHLDVSSLLDR